MVWSVPIRLLHWSLAAIVFYNLFFNASGEKPHRTAGYAAAGLVGLRALYALLAAGGRWPLPRWSDLRAHVGAMVRGEPIRHARHNPLGAAMALTMWALVLGLALSGWVSRWDRFWGEDWPIEIHSYLSLALQICVALHVLGVAASSLLERQNLVLAMITGRKQLDQ